MKTSIKNVLNFKKSALWTMVVSLGVVIIFYAAFATNDRANGGSRIVGDYDVSTLNIDCIPNSPAYEIGANKYGMPIFKDAKLAFEQALIDFKEGFAAIQEVYDIDPANKEDWQLFKAYGWEWPTEDEAVARQARGITQFFDIYENSFAANLPAAKQDATSSADHVIPGPDASSLFLSEEAANELKANLDENAANFYEFDVVFDFAHIVPVYYVAGINKNNPPKTLFETLIFAGRYILPVMDTQGKIIAIAGLWELNEKWTVGMSMEIDEKGLQDIADKIQKAQQSAQDDGNIYYVELPANNSFGFLAVLGNEEYFIHLDDYGPNEMLSGKDILSGIIEEYTENGDNDTDG